MGKIISVIGGDLRQLTLAYLLKEEGYTVKIYGFGKDSISYKLNVSKNLKEACKCDILILPMPITTDGTNINTPLDKEKISAEDILKNIGSKTFILGGRIDKNISDLFREYKIIDYYMREELMIKNAVATAEGAIGIAMEETPVTISKSKCLVIGYGRVGKVLSDKLCKLGADVTVSARKYSDIAWIDVCGYKSLHNDDIKVVVDEFDVIFNTVPALILDKAVLSLINNDCVIIDLASKPGGIDFEKAKDLGLKVIWALSIPGKCAPITSGKIIKETIMNIFTEEGV